MKRVLIIIMTLTITLLALTTISCSRATKIGDIQANPSQYENKELTIKGTVGETVWFSLVEKGIYQIGDSSGNIWIVTSQPPPQQGQSISVKGNVRTAFEISGQSYGTVLEETERD